jgi:hypothetical protein
MSGEWNARVTKRRFAAGSSAAAALIFSADPLRTCSSDAFAAANASPCFSASAVASARGTGQLNIAPAGHSSHARARAASNSQATGSESSPETTLAAISPTEWPPQATGVSPQSSRTRASATPIVKSSG